MERQNFGDAGWTPDRLGDLSGKTYALTGANSGIGLEATKILTDKGAKVIMLCRNPDKAAASLREIKNRDKTVLIQMDLSDLSDVRRGAEKVKAQFPQLDALICNAGIMMLPKRTLSKDGFEVQLATNHYGHFLLAGLLLDALNPDTGRIVVVSSIVHNMGPKRVQFDDLNFDKNYDPMNAYVQSKLANLYFAKELDRKLSRKNSKIKVIACHPGYSATNLQSTGPAGMQKFFMAISNILIAQSATRGSWPTCLAAADEEARSDIYYGPSKWQTMRGPVQGYQPARHAFDEEAAKRLWEISEENTKFTWAF